MPLLYESQEDVHMPKTIDPAVEERALRMFAEHRQGYPSDTALAGAPTQKDDVGRETAESPVGHAEVSAGARPGTADRRPRRPYKTLADVEYATAGWVDWCSHRRPASFLGMLTPAEHEQDHHAALGRDPCPV